MEEQNKDIELLKQEILKLKQAQQVTKEVPANKQEKPEILLQNTHDVISVLNGKTGKHLKDKDCIKLVANYYDAKQAELDERGDRVPFSIKGVSSEFVNACREYRDYCRDNNLTDEEEDRLLRNNLTGYRKI